MADLTRRSLLIQLGAAMPNSMICECTAGVLEVSQDAMTTTMNKGDIVNATATQPMPTTTHPKLFLFFDSTRTLACYTDEPGVPT